jgi:hypothetical protein
MNNIKSLQKTTKRGGEFAALRAGLFNSETSAPVCELGFVARASTPDFAIK